MSKHVNFALALQTAGDFGIAANLYINGALASGKCGITFAKDEELVSFVHKLQPARVMVSGNFPAGHAALKEILKVINTNNVIITPPQNL